MSVLSQGTLVRYIRSKNHPDIKCSGIVINARCDLAQNKIKYVSMLSCMTLDDWIVNVAFFEICETIRKEKYNALNDFCKKYKLNPSILMEFGITKAKISIEACGAKSNEINKLLPKLEELAAIENNLKNPPSEDERIGYIKANEKKVKDILTKLHNGALTKYCFIPEKAYNRHVNTINNGIVVDLHDIIQISYDDYIIICEGKCDCRSLDALEQQRLNMSLLLENDGFVDADKEHIIQSPWIESLLQHFSLAYTRIGVENATDNEITEYLQSL